MKQKFLFIGEWDADLVHQVIKTKLGHLYYKPVSVKTTYNKFYKTDIHVITVRNFLSKETMERIYAN
jgi:hypothetical protein